MSRDANLEKKLRRRSLILGLSKSFLSIVIFGKLFYLQILQNSKYGKLSDINRLKVKILYPERGTIYDLYNNPIASNKTDYQLSIFKDKRNLINKYIIKLQGHIDFSKKLMGITILCSLQKLEKVSNRGLLGKSRAKSKNFGF